MIVRRRTKWDTYRLHLDMRLPGSESDITNVNDIDRLVDLVQRTNDKRGYERLGRLSVASGETIVGRVMSKTLEKWKKTVEQTQDNFPQGSHTLKVRGIQELLQLC